MSRQVVALAFTENTRGELLAHWHIATGDRVEEDRLAQLSHRGSHMDIHIQTFCRRWKMINGSDRGTIALSISHNRIEHNKDRSLSITTASMNMGHMRAIGLQASQRDFQRELSVRCSEFSFATG